MTAVRRALTLARHLIRLARSGQLRFRLETFGIYYPALPYQAPFWRLSPRHLHLLVRRAGSYADWLREMEELQQQGPSAWWIRHTSGRDREPERRSPEDKT